MSQDKNCHTFCNQKGKNQCNKIKYDFLILNTFPTTFVSEGLITLTVGLCY